MQSTIKQLMEATVDTAAATPASRPGAAVRRRRQSAPPPPRWRVIANKVLAKLRTRRTWVATMFILGSLDVILNLVNFAELSSDELNYGLVIGPPTQELWTSLCVFTVFGTLLYIPESINTFSVLYSTQGDTIVALHYELPVTLLLEHIPLAATDYFVARCRREYTTNVESVCGIVRLLFIFLRLIWYAHIEGKKIKKNDKHEVNQILVMVICLLISIAIAFPFMNWRHEPKGKLKPHHLTNVSIFMLRRPPPPEGLWYTLELTELLEKQGWDDRNSSLIPSAWEIYKAYLKGKGYYAVYRCDHTAPEKPPECRHARFLLFKFYYSASKRLSPYGEIAYNYAEMCLDATSVREEMARLLEDDYDVDDITTSPYFPFCNQATRRLSGGWRLFYFEAHRWHHKHWRVNASQPFRKAYTSPMPKYLESISVCSNATVKRCMPKFGEDCSYDDLIK